MRSDPGSEKNYRLLWDAMVKENHVPIIKPVFLPIFSGWLGECHKCKLMAFSGERLHDGYKVFGSAIENKCVMIEE